MKKSEKEALKQLKEHYGWQVLQSVLDGMIQRVSDVILNAELSEQEYRVLQANLKFMRSFKDIDGILKEAQTIQVEDDPYE
ncbi:MAG: hypothetical protein D6822_02205 [Cyanobacteria bacterium J149]|nr:MAG: hypothetical protein D6822_02205 [Cyanobacteria bacterium J149]